MTKQFIEYDDSPSGSVYFYHYKEPLMKFKEGYGFEGALVADEKSGQVQCHFCGGWYDYLQHHLHREHNMMASEYKEAVGLMPKTALISESFRAKMIAKGLEARKSHIYPHRQKHTAATIEKIRVATTKAVNTMEKKNRTNTCPEQLLDRLITLANKLGRTPAAKEVGFKLALRTTYGTYAEACRLAGLNVRRRGERILQRRKFSPEELLGMLRNFEATNGRRPSSSDCRRGLLASRSRYTYYFGSWQKALNMAFK